MPNAHLAKPVARVDVRNGARAAFDADATRAILKVAQR